MRISDEKLLQVKWKQLGKTEINYLKRKFINICLKWVQIFIRKMKMRLFVFLIEWIQQPKRPDTPLGMTIWQQTVFGLMWSLQLCWFPSSLGYIHIYTRGSLYTLPERRNLLLLLLELIFLVFWQINFLSFLMGFPGKSIFDFF